MVKLGKRVKMVKHGKNGLKLLRNVKKWLKMVKTL
jgi:hypothetical protein